MGTLIIFLLVFYFLGLTASQLFNTFHKKAKLEEVNSQIIETKIENEKKRKEVELLNNPRYLEILARRNLGMVRTDSQAEDDDEDDSQTEEKQD